MAPETQLAIACTVIILAYFSWVAPTLKIFFRNVESNPDGIEARWESSSFWKRRFIRSIPIAAYIPLALFWPVYLIPKAILAAARAIRWAATHTWKFASKTGSSWGKGLRSRFGRKQRRQHGQTQHRDEEAGVESPGWVSIELDRKSTRSLSTTREALPEPAPAYTPPRSCWPNSGRVTSDPE